MAKAYVGTSGWHYDSWHGPFYPEDTKTKDFLSYYAGCFPAVEINNSFYRLPKPETLKAWCEQVPKSFRFACKASRFTTHMKKLKDPKHASEKFFNVIKALDGRLGPILFQLPPNWAVNVERLAAFLEAVPGRYRYTFEFRDPSWFCDEVYDTLRKHKAAFCIYDLNRKQSPIEVTADFVYIRLHGPERPYEGSYDGRTLAGWARRIKSWQKSDKDVYCFFDNDQKANAPKDARRLQEKL